MIAYIIIYTLLLVAATIVLRRTIRMTRAIEHQALLCDDITGCCESLGFIGCSVVCSSVSDLQQINRLLGQDYGRYEVVVVLDSALHTEDFNRLVSHFKMVRVNCASTEELPSVHIENLYRSRQRSFRRLILVDAPYRSAFDDMNAGVTVASYDHILPIGTSATLRPRAVENLAIILCSTNARNCSWIRSRTTHDCLFLRNAIIDAGGFSADILQRCGRGYHTYAPIADHEPARKVKFSLGTTIIVVIFTLLLVSGAAIDARIAIAIMLAAGVALASAKYVATIAKPTNCSAWDVIYLFRKIVDIFPARKFSV